MVRSSARRILLLSGILAAVVLIGALSPEMSIANHLQCSNSIDDDNDGRIDFPFDPDCASSDDATEAGSAAASSSSLSSSVSSSSQQALTLTISDGKNSVRPGDSMIYAITLTQTSPNQMKTDVELFLPANAQLISPDQGGIVTGNRVRWTNITLQPGVQQRFSAQVGVSPNASVGTSFDARVVAAGVEATDMTMIQSSAAQAAPFILAITDNQQTVEQNGRLTYVMTVTNSAASAQTTDVMMTLSQFFIAEQITPSTSYNSNVLTWKNIAFGPGEVKTFAVSGLVRRGAPKFASVSTEAKVGTVTAYDVTSVQTVSSSSRRSSSSSSKSSLSRSSASSVRRSVLFSKTADTNEVMPGGTVRYTIFVQNVLLTAIDDAIVQDRFDMTLLTVADAGGGSVNAAGQLEWRLPRLAPGEVWRQSYSLIVSPQAANGSQLSNVATISGNDVAGAALNEKVVTVSTGVVQHLPATGAPFDLLFVLIGMPMAAFAAFGQRQFARM